MRSVKPNKPMVPAAPTARISNPSRTLRRQTLQLLDAACSRCDAGSDRVPAPSFMSAFRAGRVSIATDALTNAPTETLGR